MEIKVPALGESITEATISRWLKAPGQLVQEDEPIVELETDKITVEVNAPGTGVLTDISAAEGEDVAVGAIIGMLDPNATPADAPSTDASQANQPPAPKAHAQNTLTDTVSKSHSDKILSPAAQKIARETTVNIEAIEGSAKGGRITKGDMLEAQAQQATHASTPPKAVEERHPMSKLRQRIAQRLKESQNTAAMLTTFNEVDMSHVMALRNRFKDAFEDAHGVKLGFMSFFTKATLSALKQLPILNAYIDGTDIVYKNTSNIGVAVGTDSGLVVPVLKNAETLSFAGIEQAINELGKKARSGTLTINDLSNGTFTISNGGVYGSLLSTPILNPPQSGILGLHKIEKRAVVINDEIVIRPMMYLALTYDHRLIDGKEAVTFLVKIKEYIEDPERMLLDL